MFNPDLLRNKYWDQYPGNYWYYPANDPSSNDDMATVQAANYFLEKDRIFRTGDLMYVTATDGSFISMVTTTGTFITLTPISGGSGSVPYATETVPGITLFQNAISDITSNNKATTPLYVSTLVNTVSRFSEFSIIDANYLLTTNDHTMHVDCSLADVNLTLPDVTTLPTSKSIDYYILLFSRQTTTSLTITAFAGQEILVNGTPAPSYNSTEIGTPLRFRGQNASTIAWVLG